MTGKVAEAVSELEHVLPQDRFVTPASSAEKYNELNGSYLSGFQSNLSPVCILLPQTSEEVVTFVKTIQPFVGHVEFAVRAAGQQPLPGCANVSGGITIDLRNLRGLDLQDDMVRIAAGERWGDVYKFLEPHGLGVTGGKSTTCGIGGLATQGGLSFFASREGLICDNVINFKVVLASGEIVNANRNHNKDLFVALRGGGNNFGIITRFDVRVFKQDPFYGGMVWYTKPSFPGQISAMVEELQSDKPDPDTHFMLSVAFAGVFGSDVICLNQLYYTRQVADPDVLRPFTHVQPQQDAMNTMKIQTLLQAATEQAGAGMSKVRCLYMNVNVQADSATLTEGSDIWCEELEPIKDAAGLMCSYTLQAYPVTLLEKTMSEGGNSMGLDPKTGPVVNILLLTYWTDKKDDERVTAFMQRALQRIKQQAAEKGKLIPWVYWNYAFSDQDALASYDEENVQKLRLASKKYDPNGMFQKACPGGFKLFQ
ncbi:hypothetical protein F4777DRAFT_587736 [Nemania sp. FL0916]|nr:hypothetical protein F4777DRAFT_587736 [Nemania sp. FL0916]